MREEGGMEPGTALVQHSAGPSAFPSSHTGIENAAPSLGLDRRSSFMLRHVPLVFARMCDLGPVMDFWGSSISSPVQWGNNGVSLIELLSGGNSTTHVSCLAHVSAL